MLVQLRTPRVDLPGLGGESDFGGRGPEQSEQRPVLVDRLERQVRYLRVSLTDRCNMRCTYCMPPEGIEHVERHEVLSLEEVVRMVRAFAAWGVERVRLTGGEPTLRRNLAWLVEQLAQIERASGRGRLEIVLTTNGELLASLAEPLAAAGLSAVTVSIDSLDPARFATITRRDRLAEVMHGIEAAAAIGLPLKLNTVAVRGFNDDELASICTFAWQHGATPRFIELMPMAGGRLFVPGELMPAAEIRARIGAELGAAQVEHIEQPGLGGETELGGRGPKTSRDRGPVGPAEYFVIRGGAWDGRRFGTIAAMTENFCGSCNRLRVSATGQLHACLARDDTGDVRAALRTDDPNRLEQVVRAALGHKRDTHGFELDGGGGPDKAMISIGG
jgi:cyclic pyranopterin phosphate synthase